MFPYIASYKPMPASHASSQLPPPLETDAHLFRALGVPDRLRILALASAFETVTPSDLCRVMGTDQEGYLTSQMSRHLRTLQEDGVLEHIPVGVARLYSVSARHVDYLRLILRPLSERDYIRADAHRYRSLLRQGQLIVDTYERKG